MMLGLMMVWISVPVQAQNVNEDEGIETVDEEDVSDSTLVDSLAADTLAQKLPWPESVKVGIDKLLESKMFETSQVGLMVWDLSADSCIYQRNERQLIEAEVTSYFSITCECVRVIILWECTHLSRNFC